MKRRHFAVPKRITAVLIVLLLVAVIPALYNVYAENSSSRQKDTPTIYDLLNDDFLKGQLGSGKNKVSIPKDPEWKLLEESKKPLNIGESYTETFDKNYFSTRLRYEITGNGVSAEITGDSKKAAAQGNSLVVDSTMGNYTGVYLNGMRFVNKGKYQVEFDYKILKASDDFFIQFRADSDGKSGVRTGDKFETIRGADGFKGKMRFVVELDNFSDYRLMIFPRNKAGIISVDNLKLTRLGSMTNDLKLGQSLTEDFDGPMRLLLDSAPSPRTSLINSGRSIKGNSLNIVNDGDFQGIYLTGAKLKPGGKYTISFDYKVEERQDIFYFQIISKSGKYKNYAVFGDDSVPLGKVERFSQTFDIASNEKEFLFQIFTGAAKGANSLILDNLNIQYTAQGTAAFMDSETAQDKISLNIGDTFTNNFDESNQLTLDTDKAPKTKVTSDKSVAIDKNTLVLQSNGSYNGIYLKGLELKNDGLYRVSFDYKVKSRQDLFYFQITSKSGNYTNFAAFGNSDIPLDRVTKFDRIMKLSTNETEFLMQIFPGGADGNSTLSIDNLIIERLDPKASALIEKQVTESKSVTEDFENGLFGGNIAPSQKNSGVFEITRQSVSGNQASNSLVINCLDAYSGVEFKDGVLFNRGSRYKVTFDYRVLENPNASAFYVQIGGKDYGELNGLDKNKSGSFTGTLTCESSNGNPDVLQMFSNQPGLKIAIDNIKIELARVELKNKKLGIGEIVKHDFDSESSIIIDTDATPDTSITGQAEKAIQGKSLLLQSSGEYKGIYLKGVGFESKGVYRVRFDYKVYERKDLFYFQFVSTDGQYKNFGSFGNGDIPLNQLRTFDQVFILNSASEDYILQMFPGGLTGNSSVAIDNLMIERLDPKASVFEQRKLSGDTRITEDFEKGLYGGMTTPSQKSSGVFEIIESDGSKGLKIACMDPYSGVEFKYGVNFETGKKYNVYFDYRVLENPQGSAFYVQIGGRNYKELNSMGKGSNGKFQGTLICGSAHGNPEVLQFFSNKSGMQVVIDNLRIELSDKDLVDIPGASVPSGGGAVYIPDPDISVGVGEVFTNDFDSLNSLKIDKDAVPATSITDDPAVAINGRSLLLQSDGQYSGIYLKGIDFVKGGIYRIKFDYKVISRQDLFYFQMISKSGVYKSFVSFGNADIALDQVRTFDQIFTLDTAETGFLMQLFPGGTAGSNKLAIDNFVIERIDASATAFVSKSINDTTPITEDFENGLYMGAMTPSQKGSGSFQLISGGDAIGSGSSLKISSNDPYTGVEFKYGLNYEAGKKYKVVFDYKVLANPNGSAMYIQIGGQDYKELNGLTDGSTGRLDTILTCGSAHGNPEVLQLFSNMRGIDLVIDNLSIVEYVPPAPPADIYSDDFDSQPSYSFGPNNTGIVTLSAITAEIPAGGSGNALLVDCVNQYDGVVLTPLHYSFDIGQKYNLDFILKGVSIPTGATIYIQSGGNFVQLPLVDAMDSPIQVTLTAGANNIQMFSSMAGVKFSMDNLRVSNYTASPINPVLPEVYESFDGSYGIAVSPNGTGVVTGSAIEFQEGVPSSALQVDCINAFDGVQFALPTLTTGNKYKVTFKLKTLSNPNGSSLYVQFGTQYVLLDCPEVGNYEEKTLNLIAENNNLQMFSNLAGLQFAIDDLKVESVVSSSFFGNFDEQDNFVINANNSATLTPTFNPSERPTGSTNKALKVLAEGSYGGVVLTPSEPLVTDGRYMITFRYRVLSNPSGGPLYMQLGGGKDSVNLDATPGSNKLQVVTLTAAENIIQMFCGNDPGIEFTIDDFLIQKVN